MSKFFFNYFPQPRIGLFYQIVVIALFKCLYFFNRYNFMKKIYFPFWGTVLITLLLCFMVACQSGTKIYLVADDVNGLKAGNKVLANGVEIGKVEKVSLEGTEAICRLSIKEDIQISRRSVFSIRSAGIWGGKQVEVVLSDIGPFLADGDTIVGGITTKGWLEDIFGKDATINFDSLKQQVGQSFKDLGNIIDSLDLTSLGDSIRLKAKESGLNLDSLLHELKDEVEKK